MERSGFVDRLASIMVDPAQNAQGRGKAVKALRWASAIILGVATVGLAQGASALYRKVSGTDFQNDTIDSIKKLFNGILKEDSIFKPDDD